MNESEFQRKLIKELKAMFPGCIVMKTDSNYIQGFPDLLVLFESKWALLEVKRSRLAKTRPNQSHYVSLLDGMSFSAFIYPENMEEVLYALQQTFRDSRQARLFEPE